MLSRLGGAPLKCVRSGMSDFNAFIMEDFMDATFFHLLLGPLVAAVLGLLGGLLGKAIALFQKP